MLQKIIPVIIATLFFQNVSVFAFENVSADTLFQWLKGNPPYSFVLLDVRDSHELAEVISIGSAKPYWLSYKAGDLKSKHSLLPKATPVVIYCRSGNRSVSASNIVEKSGYTAVNLLGGIKGWKSKSFPIGTRKDVYALSRLPEPSILKPTAVQFHIMSKKIRRSVYYNGGNLYFYSSHSGGKYVDLLCRRKKYIQP